MREALDKNGAQDALCPTWIPESFALDSVEVTESGRRKMFTARYVDGENRIILTISLQNPERIKNMLETTEEVYVEEIINGDTYYVLDNNDYIRAFGLNEGYGYNLRGQISHDELLDIIDSLYR